MFAFAFAYRPVAALSLLLLLCLSAGCTHDARPTVDAQPIVDARPSVDAGRADGGGDAAPDAELYPNLPSGNPLVPEVAAYPYPSDFYLVDDATTKTGRRVAFPDEALPSQIKPIAINGADGFSRITPILAFLPGSIDDATLPAEDDPAATVKTTSSVLLVKANTNELVPILAENDLNAPNDDERALIIRPLRSLEPKSGYVVILTNKLKDKSGKPHRANPAVRALLDGTPTTEPAIEKQRKAFELVNATIAKVGIEKEAVVLAWSFHTRSEEQVTAPLLSMQDQAMQWTLGAYTIDSDTVDSNKNRQIVGTFTAPNFISPEHLIELDDKGVPKQFGETQAELRLTIPNSIVEARPVILYGHGFLGAPDQGTRGSWNKLCRKNRFISIGSHFGFNEKITSTLITALGSDLSGFRKANADVLQTFVNYTVLGRLVREKLATKISKSLGGGQLIKPLDPQQVHYLGISNGGTFGFVVAATQPKLTRAVMVVGGGGLVHFLQRSVVWNSYAPLVDLLFKYRSLESQLAFAVLQTTLDPIDSMNYVHRLTENRFPGREPLEAQCHMAIHDSQVDNLVSEWVYRTSRTPLVTPSPKDIWGLETITAPAPAGAPAGTKSALFVYDEKVAPPPEGNVPPATDNDTHSTVRNLVSYQKHVAEFLENGKFVQVCEGACDPE